MTNLVSVLSSQCFWESHDVTIRFGLSVYVLKSVSMVDLRPLRKSQAVGRVSVLAGCRMVLLPLGLLALRVVSCDLCNRMFSLAITFSLLFSPGISGALGVNKCSSDCSSAAPLSFFSQTFALCSRLPFCTDVLCMSLPTFLKSPLS